MSDQTLGVTLGLALYLAALDRCGADRLTSPLGAGLVWLWHATLDGTRLCRCRRSREMRDSAHRQDR